MPLPPGTGGRSICVELPLSPGTGGRSICVELPLSPGTGGRSICGAALMQWDRRRGSKQVPLKAVSICIKSPPLASNDEDHYYLLRRGYV